MTWITAVLENLFFAGVIFGWANIEPVLVKEGFFSEGCVNASTPNNVTMVTKKFMKCDYQEEIFSLVFVLATSFGLLFNAIVGPALDYLGIWTVRTVLINIAAFALLITGNGSSQVLYFTFPIFHIVGIGLHVTNIQMSNIFHSSRNVYVASITGAFTAGSLTFLIISNLYEKYNISFEALFTVYSIIYFCLNFRTFLLTPRNLAPEVIPKDFRYGYKDLVQIFRKKSDPENENFNTSNSVKEASLSEFACSMLFITTVISNSVANFLYMFYISNFDVLIYSLTGNSERVEFYVSIFGALLFIGLFLWLLCCATSRLLLDEDVEDRQFKCRLIMMFVGGACTIGMQYCASFRSARLQILSMTLHVVGKASFTSSSNTHISLVFPAKLFGRLYSVMAVCEALLLFTQIPLTFLLEGVLKWNFVVFNSALTLFSLLVIVQPVYLLYRLKKNKSFD